MYSLKQAVAKALPFVEKDHAFHHVVGLACGKVKANGITSGCSIATTTTEHWKPDTLIGVAATDLRKVLSVGEPDSVTCKRNSLLLSDSSGVIKLPGIMKTSVPSFPSQPEIGDNWVDLAESSVLLLSALGEFAARVNTQQNMSGVHLSANWAATLSTQFAAVAWLEETLPIDDNRVITTPSELWTKTANAGAKAHIGDNKVWLSQEHETYWSQTLVKSISVSTLETLIDKCREQERVEGVLEGTDLVGLAKRGVACAQNPATVYEVSVVEDGGDNYLTMAGATDQARFDGRVGWVGDVADNPIVVGLSADHLLLAATTLTRLSSNGEVSMSFAGPTDPVCLYAVTPSGATLELLMSPAYCSR
jgi:hypothetical protein